MRQFITAYFFVLYSVALFAANNNEIDALNRKAESGLNQNPAQSLQLAEEALQLASDVKYISGQARATAIKGVAKFKVDDFAQASTLISKALTLSELAKDSSTLSFSIYWKANLYINQGEYGMALDEFNKALAISENINDLQNTARCLDGLAGIYETLGETDKAEDYYKQSLDVAHKSNFKEWYPAVTFSLANVAYTKGRIDEAINKFNESIALSEEVGNLNNIANAYQMLASIQYYEKKNERLAMDYTKQAMELFEKTGSTLSYSHSRLLMAIILLGDKEYNLAIELAGLSLNEGYQNKNVQLQRNASEILYRAYKSKGDNAKALEYHILYHRMSEALRDQDLTRKLTQMELQANFEKEREIEKARQDAREAELKAQLEQQRLMKKASIIGILLLAIITGLSVFAFLQKQKDNRIIAAEKKKSDELLLNILPAEVAQELKDTGTSKPMNYDMATVLFADIKNFTGAAEKMTPAKLVSEIDFYFKQFDDIVSKYNIEKIKTIGDAYLCVGGLPVPDSHNAYNVVKAALEMQQFMQRVQDERKAKGDIYFEIRIGINSGPLVAGIVGLRKFAYDIWGDTVNIAARMEQHGEEGRINITGATYNLVKDKFSCSYRGKIEAKNKGYIDMYFVDTEIA